MCDLLSGACTIASVRMTARILTLFERVYKSHYKTNPCDKAVPPRGIGCTSNDSWNGQKSKWKKAVDAAITSQLGVWCAAMQYNVPKSMLGDWVSGWVQPGSVSGPMKYLGAFGRNWVNQIFLSRCLQIDVRGSSFGPSDIGLQRNEDCSQLWMVGLIQETTSRVCPMCSSPCILSME